MALTSLIVSYDSSWTYKFEIEKSLLLKILSEDAMSIHHVGSTSVKGLIAKPEIDILFVIKPTSNLQHLSSLLVSLGYDHRGEEPGNSGHWYFSKNQQGKRTHKLHMCIEGHHCIEEQIIFRDYLRNNLSTAKKYADLKLKLERENKTGIMEYISGKEFFIIETLTTAKAEGYSYVTMDY
ncbi:MAG: GrpB family protein [Bdellovibrio sp.]|nr:GrpB family protein [Bdellovibrio sp.]